MAYKVTRSILFDHVEYGEGQTIEFGKDDVRTVAQLIEIGAVTEVADDGSDEAVLYAMTVAQLKEIAAEMSVTLPDLAKKADIIAAMVAAKAAANGE
jgi:hypothetical protein